MTLLLSIIIQSKQGHIIRAFSFRTINTSSRRSSVVGISISNGGCFKNLMSRQQLMQQQQQQLNCYGMGIIHNHNNNVLLRNPNRKNVYHNMINTNNYNSNRRSSSSQSSSSTILQAVESRELRFYNSSPMSPNMNSNMHKNHDITTTPTPTTATTTTHTSTNMNDNSNNSITTTSSNSNNNDNTTNGKYSTVKSRSNDPQFVKPFEDLSKQVSYITSLFQKSNFYNVNGNTNNDNVNDQQQQQQQKINRLFTNSLSAKSISSTTVRNYSSSSDNNNQNQNPIHTIPLTPEEKELFDLLTQVISSTDISSTLRVAGGWVRDKLLSTEEFQRRSDYNTNSGMNNNNKNKNNQGLVERLTSIYRGPSSGRQGTKLIGLPKSNSASSVSSSSMSLVNPNDLPVDIDIALDDMLGREFADHLNEWLTLNGQETISVGVVLKNPEKSKHLETATMKVGKFWIDFVNLRAEEYTEDSRIPDLMRIGTAEEDAYRRDLTINALFYNINTGQVEDFTGRGFEDLKKGLIATPLAALTTLLDDPLRVLRSVRFAARLRFTMEESLRKAAKDERVRAALAQKVARERIGSEVDLMLRSQDPVGAMRLLINLNLAGTVFPLEDIQSGKDGELAQLVFTRGLNLLSTTHDHLVDCKVNVPIWCEKKRVTAAAVNGVDEIVLMEDEELRRKLWYAAFLKPLRDHCQMMKPMDKQKVGRRQGKKANRSVIMKTMVDELKRPVRDAESVEAIMKGADEFSNLLKVGCDLSSTACLLSDIKVMKSGFGTGQTITCYMNGKEVDCENEDDPVWQGAMEYRLLVSKVLKKLGHLWRAAMILSLSEQLAVIEGEELSYTIEGDVVSVHYY